jgi:hypothetical protein
MDEEDDWEWEIAAARARAATDDPATDDSVHETDPADVLDEVEAKEAEEVEDWDAIIAAAREGAATGEIRPESPTEPPALASGSNESLPLARGSHDAIEPPPAPPVWTPPVIAADPSAPRTVIPVPALPSADPQRVLDYVASKRASSPTRGRGR